MISARTHLESLVGSDVHTLTKRLSNRILRIEQDEVVVSTGKSPSGQPVPIAWVQDAFDILE